MMIKRIEGCTRVLGQSQGYLGLPVRDTVATDADGSQVPCMETAWEPTPAEIAAIVAGQPVVLRILGTGHPPVMIWVDPA